MPQDKGRFCVLLTFLYRFVRLIVYYLDKSNIFNQDKEPSPVLVVVQRIAVFIGNRRAESASRMPRATGA